MEFLIKIKIQQFTTAYLDVPESQLLILLCPHSLQKHINRSALDPTKNLYFALMGE